VLSEISGGFPEITKKISKKILDKPKKGVIILEV
jgi:hypothetical protein